MTDAIKTAARIARKMGFHVRASKSRAGTVSSYYLTPATYRGPVSICATRRPIRISDHEIPWTGERESRASHYGGFNGYPGEELLLEGIETPARIKRLIVLTAAGRI